MVRFIISVNCLICIITTITNSQPCEIAEGTFPFREYGLKILPIYGDNSELHILTVDYIDEIALELFSDSSDFCDWNSDDNGHIWPANQFTMEYYHNNTGVSYVYDSERKLLYYRNFDPDFLFHLV